MSHKKEMSKRNSHKQTKRQKQRYMDYEKMDMSNNDLRYMHPDIMGIIIAKEEVERQKEERKMIRRIKKM